MARSYLCMHGVPNGQELCGVETQEDKSYLNRFYDISRWKMGEHPLMVIETQNGTTAYTYLRNYEFQAVDNRPGSYFGMTFFCKGCYCANVSQMYLLMDSLFKRICAMGIIIVASNGVSRYAHSSMGKLKVENLPFIEWLRAEFEKVFTSTYYSNEKFANSQESRKFSLLEADSPLFLDEMKRNQMIISQNFKTSVSIISALSEKNRKLKELVEKRSSDIDSLNKTISDLTRSSREMQDSLEKIKEELQEAKSFSDSRIKENQKMLSRERGESTRLREQIEALENSSKEKNKRIESLGAILKSFYSTLGSIYNDSQKNARPLEPGRFPPHDDRRTDGKSRKDNKKTPAVPLKIVIILTSFVLITALLLLFIFLFKQEIK